MALISYAQNAEDIVLWRALGSVNKGFYIDVGAGDPVADSVTKLFSDVGWSGVNIEPMPEPFAALVAQRPRDVNLECAIEDVAGTRAYYRVATGNPLSTGDETIARQHRDAGWSVHEVPVVTRTLADVCDEYAPTDIHFLKIDVEGRERQVLAGADFTRYRPWVVVVESVAPQDLPGTETAADARALPESTHAAWEHLLAEHDYEFVMFDGLNRFYVAGERAHELRSRLAIPANVLDGFESFRTRAEIDAPRASRRSAPASTAGSVALSGYFEQESGIGEVARSLGRALDVAGLDWSARVARNGPGTARHEHPFTSPRSDTPPDVVVVCENADSLPLFVESGALADVETLPRAGYWAWEVEGLPERDAATAEILDEIWTLSAFCAYAIGAHVSRPVYSVPPSVEVPALVDRAAARRALDLPDGFLVTFAYDALSGTARKNPWAVVDAYVQAFSRTDGCMLLLKTTNADVAPGHLDELLERAGNRPDVLVRDGYLDAATHALLAQAGDVYCSLHHAEGFGFGLAEAMAAGTPVVATGWSGNLEFMDRTNSLPVRWEPAPVPPGASPLYPVGARWVDPDVEHAAHLLRRLFDDPTVATQLGRRARASIAAGHTAAARAPLIAKRIAALRARAATSTVHLDRLLEHLEQPLDTSGPTNLGGMARAYRKSVLRALRHYDEQQRARFRAVTDVVREYDVARRDDADAAEARAAWELAREAYGRQVAVAGEPF